MSPSSRYCSSVASISTETRERTRAYVARRTLEGLSKREIMRCLKRYVAREIYRVLTAPSSA